MTIVDVTVAPLGQFLRLAGVLSPVTQNQSR